MKPKFILMLTYNDQTVENALEVFQSCKDLPIEYWGFKDVGLPSEDMFRLVSEMKRAGKTTVLEIVSLTEQEGLRGAELAVRAGFDLLMGTVYFDSIMAYVSDKPIQYFPFPGHVYSHPSILDGSIDEIVAHAGQLQNKGVHGLDLLTYRYVGEPASLLPAVVKAMHIPVVSAGSIESFARIAEVWQAGAWGFTIGSALFDKKFVPQGSFRENAACVCDWLAGTNVPPSVGRQMASEVY